MLKQLIIVSALFINASFAFATHPIDSIGIENNNGKKLIIHKVDPKESYFSIARKYQVNVKEIQTYNKNIALQIGTIIKVPTEVPYSVSTPKTISNNAKSDTFEYKVLAKDNLNLIAERFACSIEEIKQLNNLNASNLQIGQILKIPFAKLKNNTSSDIAQNEIKTIGKPIAISKEQLATELVEHIVKPKEYLNLIAKQYGVTADDIKKLNNLSSSNLHIGQVLKIQTSNTNTENALVENKATVVKEKEPKKEETKIVKPIDNEPFFEHTVLAGETIYSIAHKYQLTTFQLKNSNNLSSNDLIIGQKLKIKGIKPVESSAKQDVIEVDSTSTVETIKNPNLKRAAEAYGLSKVDEKGTAVWIADPDLDAKKMLVLHKTAPIGTVVQITNPMTNRSTFAKVVGKFTDNEVTKDAIIVMTKAVADAIGALDKRFLCNLSYGVKE